MMLSVTCSDCRTINYLNIMQPEDRNTNNVTFNRLYEIAIWGTFECHVCGAKLSSRQSLGIHQEAHASVASNKLKCTLCPRDFLDQRRLRAHENGHVGKIKSCPLCPAKLSEKYAFKTHMKMVHSNISFSCDICQSNFSSKQYLKMHQNTHKEEKSFKCSMCKLQFNFSSSLKDHTQRYHRVPANVENQTCNICSKIFLSTIALRQHNKSIHKGITFPCTICSHKAKSTDSLRIHMRRHTGERPFVCNMCSKNFATGANLKVHKKSHTDKKEMVHCRLCEEEMEKRNLKYHTEVKHRDSLSEIHDCGKCGKEFFRKESLRKHLIIHDKYKQFVCTLCQKEFTQKVHLKHHVTIHSSEKPEKCPYCENTFRLNGSMQKHIRKIHTSYRNSETCMYKCENCQKAFRTPVGENHQKFCRKLIYSQTSICCKICGKDLTPLTLFSISLHLKCHQTNIETYKCEFCEKRFSQKSNKNTHENNVHKKINKFACKICETTFTKRVGLENHIKTQHQVGEYKCKACPSIFAVEQKLKIHSKFHDVARPFVCRVCHWRFPKNDAMKSHLTRHHPESIYKCDKCASSYILEAAFLNHQTVHDTGRQFECKVCHLRYLIQPALTWHMKKHTDKFACVECDRKFSDSAGLRRHNEEQHEERLHNCLQCKYSSKRPSGVKRHTQNAHYL